MDRVISDLELATAVAAVVQEAGYDYVYERKRSDYGSSPACLYVWNGKPDCFVGRVLHRLGLPLEELATFESLAAYAVCERVVPGTTQAQREALTWAQNASDQGAAWGYVQQVFEQKMGLVS